MKYPSSIRTISLLAILIVFAIVMYAIVPKYTNNLNTSTSTPSPSLTSTVSPISGRTLTPQEQAVLKIPLHYASDEEKTKHTQQVAKLATTAAELDITSCTPTPTVYQIKLNGSFTILNNDPIPHTLRYMSSRILVPSHGSTTIKTSQLFKTPGDYGYGCDNPFARHGVMVVK